MQITKYADERLSSRVLVTLPKFERRPTADGLGYQGVHVGDETIVMEYEIKLSKLLYDLAHKCQLNRSGKARMLSGLITAKRVK